jgi:hypothetical protein
MGSIDNRTPTTKNGTHACRIVSRTLHAYGLIWESCIQLCDYMWWCVHDYVNIWWSLCTCNDGVELLIMWIDLVIRWWCKDSIYVGFIIWELICLFKWEYHLRYWIVEYMIFVVLNLFLCSWFPLLSISHPFTGFRQCHLFGWCRRAGLIVSTRG